MTTLIISAAATWAMVGLIWTIQLVHYPMLASYSAMAPRAAAVEHQRRISRVVGPLMASEGVTTLVLLVDRPDTMSATCAFVAAALLGIALGSTILVQVPLHTLLAEGSDDRAAERLITTNWLRTIAWSSRGLVLAWVMAT